MKLLWHLKRLVAIVAKKRIVFVIVEGPSDETALGYILNKYFEGQNHKVYVNVVHGDITSQSGINPSNILKEIASLVKNYAKKYGYKAVNFQQIIHLIDTDGAFIPENAILEDESIDEIIYTEEHIKCKCKEQIVSRNKQKSSVLIKLVQTDKMWGSIPYQAYYMSSNLDHVLYNLQNSTDEEKEQNAKIFRQRYIDDPAHFVHFISDSDFAVHGEYRETWSFIRDGLNSLNRHSNFNICFE